MEKNVCNFLLLFYTKKIELIFPSEIEYFNISANSFHTLEGLAVSVSTVTYLVTRT